MGDILKDQQNLYNYRVSFYIYLFTACIVMCLYRD